MAHHVTEFFQLLVRFQLTFVPVLNRLVQIFLEHRALLGVGDWSGLLSVPTSAWSEKRQAGWGVVVLNLPQEGRPSRPDAGTDVGLGEHKCIQSCHWTTPAQGATEN